jgi:hypothetical protein
MLGALKRAAICVLLTVVLSGCQRQKTTVFIDRAHDLAYAKSACEVSAKDHQAPCWQRPEQIANELEDNFIAAFQQSPACQDVSVHPGNLKATNPEAMETGWSLSFNVSMNGSIDYPGSEWEIIDNKTLNGSAGTLKDMNEAATRVCVVAAGKGGSISK